VGDFKDSPKCGARVGDWVGRCEDCGHIFGSKKTRKASGSTGAGLTVVLRALPWVLFVIALGANLGGRSELDKLRSEVGACSHDVDRLEKRVDDLERLQRDHGWR